jgi:hypothetical protein
VNIKVETHQADGETVSGMIIVTVMGDAMWTEWEAANTPVDRMLVRQGYDVVVSGRHQGARRIPLSDDMLSDLVAAHLNAVGSEVAV